MLLWFKTYALNGKDLISAHVAYEACQSIGAYYVLRSFSPIIHALAQQRLYLNNVADVSQQQGGMSVVVPRCYPAPPKMAPLDLLEYYICTEGRPS